MGNAASVDDSKLRRIVKLNPAQTELGDELSHLLGLVLVDFAAERGNGKRFHNLL